MDGLMIVLFFAGAFLVGYFVGNNYPMKKKK